MMPNAPNAGSPTNDFIQTRARSRIPPRQRVRARHPGAGQRATAANTNGAVIPARSENDTGNNPHNPMYGICRAGADGELLTLIGSRELGVRRQLDGACVPRSIRRPARRRSTARATSRASSTPASSSVFSTRTTRSRSWNRSSGLSDRKIGARRHGHHARRGHQGPRALRLRQGRGPDRPLRRSVGAQSGARSGHRRRRRASSRDAEFDGDDEFRKTAAVMKMVINGYAGAGTITMGGYDYHSQGPRDRRAARPPRRPLHGRLPRVRGAPRRAAHALRVQRRLALRGRRRRQQRRRPRQVRLVERQPADRGVVLPGLQPGAAARHSTPATAARPSSTSSSAGSRATGRSRPRRRPRRTT